LPSLVDGVGLRIAPAQLPAVRSIELFVVPCVETGHVEERSASAGAPDVLEGGAPSPRVIIVEFDSAQRARDFYRSSRYQEAKALRTGAAEVSMYVVEGVSAKP
jgi:hypothetical protein